MPCQQKGGIRTNGAKAPGEEIYREYHGRVLGYFRSRIGDTEQAEDLCADVFVKVFENLDRYDEQRASLSTWIFTITRNRLTDYYRTRRIFSEIPEEESDDFSMEEDICNRETLDELADALASLPERERDLMILHYYSGCTLKEIAEKMGISYAYVKILHNKAISALRQKME